MLWRILLSMMVVTLFFTTPVWAELQDGLVGYWPMDEGSGDTVADASGNGNGGTAVDTNWVEGKYDKALEFNGATSIVDIPYFDQVTPVGGATISAWVYPTDTTRSCIAGQFNSYGMALLDGLQLKSVIWGDDWVEGAITIPMEEWSFLTMTWDVDNSERLMYLNSERVAQRPNPIPIPNVQTNFGIGKWSGSFGWEDMFMGSIDDVRLWNRVLAEDEVRQAGEPAPVEPRGKLANTWAGIKSH